MHIAARLNQDPAARKELSPALTALLTIIQSITARPGLLDAKLAEYAFVPISQVLRLSRQVPVRSLELCLECISLLLDQAWGGSLEPALSAQLLILFTFLAKPSSADNGIAATSEELQSLAFTCMGHLLATASRTSQGKEAIIATQNIPILAEAVLIMLDSLVDSKSTNVRLQAVTALSLLIDAIPDDDALASFLPRMVSSLTKVLTPSSSNRPSFRVVEKAIHVLSASFSRLLSDQNTRDLPTTASPESSANQNTVSRSQSWLQATAAQIKIALANVLKLRDHDKPEVREALLKLCFCIITECRTSLSLCTSMIIEAIISMVGRDDASNTVENKFKAMLSADQNLADLLRESLHGWIISLPRIMQSKDDHGRRRTFHQVSTTLRFLDQGLSTVDERLANSLRDGISTVFSESKNLEELDERKPSAVGSQALMTNSTNLTTLQPLSFRFKGQDDAMAEFSVLIQELARSDTALAVAQELSVSIDAGPLEGRLASFWVCVQILKSMNESSTSFDDLIDMGTPNAKETLLDDMYCHALETLTQNGSSADMPWQYSALALEVVALQATRFGPEFRPELSEVLYPVLHCLGSPNAALQGHAITCLNIISKALEYPSTKDLVVTNVDYVINAVGLKLAFGDISPQGPQVLLMMLRLCGPSLLPYLDDLVGSMFDVLERYHGYPQLAELVFSVLKGMLEEGIKAPEFLLTSSDQEDQHQMRRKPLSMSDVVAAVQKLATFNQQRREQDDKDTLQDGVPQKPWKDIDTTDPEDSSTPAHDQEPPSDNQATEAPPPAPKIFTMFLKVSELTQHYLTTKSPRLRTSLLSLLNTTIPTLAKHESSFLPLINTLWPVLLPRLQDPEAYVVSSAMQTIALMCEHARSFMRTRIEDAWDVIVKVYQRARAQTTGRKSDNVSLKSLGITSSMAELSVQDHSNAALYVDTPSRMIWKSLVNLLCAISKHVMVSEERFEEILDMLDPVLEQAYVSEALAWSNPDALWLRLYKKRKAQTGKLLAEQRFPREKFATAVRLPVGKASWAFKVY